MNSNLRIVKICAYCKQEFIARKTTSQTCSDACAKRLYKLRQWAEVETEVKRKPGAFATEDQVRVIQVKEFLTLKEAALLLNVSPLTLGRWVLAGKVKSVKVGRKHVFKRNLFDWPQYLFPYMNHCSYFYQTQIPRLSLMPPHTKGAEQLIQG